jgi:hypothetical protein
MLHPSIHFALRGIIFPECTIHTKSELINPNFKAVISAGAGFLFQFNKVLSQKDFEPDYAFSFHHLSLSDNLQACGLKHSILKWSENNMLNSGMTLTFV